MLPNDPSFDLDFLQLPPFDFDAPLDGSFLLRDRQASWTDISLASRSSNNTQLPLLVVDADSSAGGSYAGGFNYAASGVSNLNDSPTPFGRALNFQDDEDPGFDIGLSIDEKGNIIEDPPQGEPQLPAFPSKSKIPAPGKAAQDDVIPTILNDDGDIIDLTAQVATSANAASSLLAEKAGAKLGLITETPSSLRTMSSPSTLRSRQAHQRAGRSKARFLDDVNQIPLREYFDGVSNYASNMEQAAAKRDRARAVRVAGDVAKNRDAAYRLTFGRGIFGVGDVVNGHRDHPLAQLFAGDRLAETLYAEALSIAKRRKAETAELSTPVPRGVMGGVTGIEGFDDEQDIELGRQPMSAISDNPSLALNPRSSILPGSSARGSAQHSAIGIRRLSDGRLSSTAFPDSPSFIERYSDEGMDLVPPQLPNQSGNPFLPFGIPAAALTGGASATKEGDNSDSRVGEEMRNAAALMAILQKKAADEGLSRPGPSTHRWVEFGDVVAPFKKNRAAVVGAFMGLLTLATSRKIRIQSDEGNVSTIDRDIFVGVKVGGGNRGKKKRTFQDMTSDNRGEDADQPRTRFRLGDPSSRAEVAQAA